MYVLNEIKFCESLANCDSFLKKKLKKSPEKKIKTLKANFKFLYLIGFALPS